MAKDKKASKAAAVPAPTPAVSKPIEKVKDGRVKKSAESAKLAAKDTAKKTAKKVEKKSKRAPTPESESSDSESEADTSSSSASSDDDSEDEVDTKKVNGTAKAAAKKDESDGEDTSDGTSDGTSDASDSDDEPAPKVNGAAKTNGTAKAVNGKDDDSDDSSSTSDDDEANAGAQKNDVLMADTKDDADSSDASASSDDDSADDSEDDDEAEVEKPKAAEPENKKRKAEETIDQTPKKTKITVNGEQKDPVSNLFIGNLSWNVDEDWLAREFEPHGMIKGCRIITDRDSGNSKGFGYVEYMEVDSAIAAIEAKQGFMMDGRELRIDFSQPRQPRADGATPQQRSSERRERYGDVPKEPSSTLFVGNISFSADESMLTEAFSPYGSINGIRLPTDRETGTMKGFGYVEMGSIDEAKAAFESLNGIDIGGRAIRLDYSTPKPQNDSPGGFRGGRGGGRGRGGFGDRGGRGGGRGGFGDRGGRGGGRGRGGDSRNRGGFGDFSGKKTSF